MRTFSWLLLAGLLTATLVGAATFDRRGWPSVVGDEATYLMAAASLGWDHDLRYERRDYDRFLARWGVPPDGLILQSSDGGRTLVYGKPAVYPALLAPLLRLAPRRGPWIANALLLALAAIAAARALERRVGPAAPLWVAAAVFASVTFAYVFWAHTDLFLACLTAIALALVYGQPQRAERVSSERDGRGRPLPWFSKSEGQGVGGTGVKRDLGEGVGWGAAARFACGGALLALVVLARPPYAPLFLPALLAAAPGTRRRAGAALAGGALGLVLLAGVCNAVTRGTWTGYSGERRSFYAYTGFPGVGEGAGEWSRQIEERGDANWVKPETFLVGFDARQTAWNVLYYLVGRHVGVLVYFLPLLLGVVAFRRGEGRWALPLAAVIAAALLFWLRPFNFYGGGGTIANRYFLPAYPALWFLAARPLRGVRAWLPPLLAALLAAPFLWPLWTSPRAFPIAEDGGYRWTSTAARRWLPYETTLSHLKPAGQEDLQLNGMWVKLLTPGLHAVEGGAALGVASGRPAELLVGSSHPLSGVVVLPTSRRLDVEGATPANTTGDGRRVLSFRHPRAVHRMWWTDDPFYLYQVRLLPPPSGPDAVFRISPDPAGSGRAATLPSPSSTGRLHVSPHA